MPIYTRELYFSWLEVEQCFARLFSKMHVDETTECFEWIGARRNDYGVMSIKGRTTGVHRVMLACLYRALPTCVEVDHLCHNRACFNPGHLEPVTHKVNVGRRLIVPRTHCKHGHELTIENIRRDVRGRRTCITCSSETARRWREENQSRMNEISRLSYARVGRKDRR